MNSLKQELHAHCLRFLSERLRFLENTIKDLQAAANEETKSTAGDKYETGRAMAQLEIDKIRLQVENVKKQQQELARVPVVPTIQQIRPGSLIFTNRGNFYIAINAGQHVINNVSFVTVSASAPIAQKFNGLMVNEGFTLNKSEYTILEIQ